MWMLLFSADRQTCANLMFKKLKSLNLPHLFMEILRRYLVQLKYKDTKSVVNDMPITCSSDFTKYITSFCSMLPFC